MKPTNNIDKKYNEHLENEKKKKQEKDLSTSKQLSLMEVQDRL